MLYCNCFFTQCTLSHSSFMTELLFIPTMLGYWQLIAAPLHVEPLPLVAHLNSLLSSPLHSLFFDLCSHLVFSLFILHHSAEGESFNRISMAANFQSYVSNQVGQFVQGELSMMRCRLWSWSHWSLNQHGIMLYQLTSISIMKSIWCSIVLLFYLFQPLRLNPNL